MQGMAEPFSRLRPLSPSLQREMRRSEEQAEEGPQEQGPKTPSPGPAPEAPAHPL